MADFNAATLDFDAAGNLVPLSAARVRLMKIRQYAKDALWHVEGALADLERAEQEQDE